jgi:hypothetical protein
MDRTGQRIWDFITGTIILGFGVALLMGNLDLLDFRTLLFRYWPVLLILLGVRTVLLGSRSDGDIAVGAFCLVAGTLFFLSVRGWLTVPLRNLILPLLVIWFGVSILYRPSCGSPARRNGDSCER